MKTEVTLSNTPFAAGDEVDVLAGVPAFAERHVADNEVFIEDGWWGAIPLIRDNYDETLYGLYSGADAGHMMFDEDCTHFKVGNQVWWGVVRALILPVGA